jgi:DNA repair exonuclease SbcCD ATPase subunit
MNLDQLFQEYDNLKSQAEYLQLEKTRLTAEAIPEEVRARLDEIEAEFGDKAEFVQQNIAAIEAQIITQVKDAGETKKGAGWSAVYYKGRISWDTKKLDGMIALIPQLSTARNEGEPYVTFRRAK